jgi:hypothetical protein
VRIECCPQLAGTTQILHHDVPPSAGRVIAYDPVFDEYHHVEPPGQLTGEALRFCPWCGTTLPPSQRLAWFEAVARLGHAPDDPDLPAAFCTSRWREGG